MCMSIGTGPTMRTNIRIIIIREADCACFVQSIGVLKPMVAAKDALVVTALSMLEHLTPDQVVVLNGDLGPLDSQQEEALCAFVEQGGGLVCIGNAAEVYHEYELLGEVLGNIHGHCTPRSEIIA